MHFMNRRFVITAALLALLGVALGAFGTHGLGRVLADHGREDTFQSASQYHLYHALALVGIAWASTIWPSRLIHYAGYFFIVGIILFSGSLYLLAIFELPVMGAIAPLGGAAFIAGWFCLGLAAWRGK